MRTRLITTALLGAMLLAAMWGAVARAQVLDTNLEITEFGMAPVDTPHAYPPDAGGRQPGRQPLLPVLWAGDPDHQRRARLPPARRIPTHPSSS